MLEKTTRINYLFDFYQELLTEKQRHYMEMYYLEDFSLGEISEMSAVSRQAVYDNIRRTEAMLEEYESKLELYKKFQQRIELLNRVEALYKEGKYNQIGNLIDSLKELD